MGEKIAQALQQLQAHARHAMAQRAQTRRQHRTGGGRIEQLSQAAAMEGVQVARQGLDVLQGTATTQESP